MTPRAYTILGLLAILGLAGCNERILGKSGGSDAAVAGTGGVGGSAGVAGFTGTGGVGGSGGSGAGGDAVMICGSHACQAFAPMTGNAFPPAVDLTPQHCCTSATTCGVTNVTLLGTGCIERDAVGEPNPECPAESPTLGASSSLRLTGCCRADNRCGLDLAGSGIEYGTGCIERGELGAAMASASVVGWLGSPPMWGSIPCSYIGDTDPVAECTATARAGSGSALTNTCLSCLCSTDAEAAADCNAAASCWAAVECEHVICADDGACVADICAGTNGRDATSAAVVAAMAECADSCEPRPVLRGAAELALGDQHSCARMDDGTVRCWGGNGMGELGGGTQAGSATPVAVSGLGGVVEIAAGESHTCARTSAGRVFCWGSNSYGQAVGDHGVRGPIGAPEEVVLGTEALEIAAGSWHNCARLAGGQVRCWGFNAAMPGAGGGGQLGDGTVTDAVELALGETHSCARISDGTVGCWGNNMDGQLGDGTWIFDRAAPAPVIGLTDVVALGVQYLRSCARMSDGRVYCWGDGSNVPQQALGITGPVEFTSGGSRSCKALDDGSVRCWTSGNSPSVTIAGLPGAVEIADGLHHSCARLKGGVVRCWGDNFTGQLGDGTRTDRPTPVTVLQ